jgi:hypothetical protein
MIGLARGSPATRGVANISERIDKLQAFADAATEKSMSAEEMREAVGAELWDSYWQHVATIAETMTKAQAEAEMVRPLLERAFAARQEGKC